MVKILLVDDEPSILRSTEILLTDLGFTVVTTMDHRKVVQLVREEQPDLLLQDVRMPGLDLEALIKSIRSDAKTGRTPILLFSASIDLPEIQKKVGASGFLEKPFRPDEVVNTIERTIAGAPPVASS